MASGSPATAEGVGRRHLVELVGADVAQSRPRAADFVNRHRHPGARLGRGVKAAGSSQTSNGHGAGAESADPEESCTEETASAEKAGAIAAVGAAFWRESREAWKIGRIALDEGFPASAPVVVRP